MLTKKHGVSVASKVCNIGKVSKNEFVLAKLKSFIESHADISTAYENTSLNNNEENVDISSTFSNLLEVNEDQGQTSDFKIQCPRCKMFLRPLFQACRRGHFLCKNCRQHIDSDTKEAVAFEACGDDKTPLLRLDIQLRNLSDKCQYGCGLHGKVLDLIDHEEACLLRCKCAVYSCPWLGGLDKIIKHVEDDHPGILVDASTVEDNFTLGFEHPVLLVTRLNKTSPSNDLYWLRLHKNVDDSQFVLMQYQGQVGQMVDKKFLINEYYVYPVNHPNLPINNEVIFPKSNQDVILNDKFVESQGTDVTIFNADKFLIKIKDVLPFDTKTLPENLGCPKEINTLAKNYSLGALPDVVLTNEGNVIKMEEEIPCWYVESGCSFTSNTGVGKHVQECEYQPTKCMHEVVPTYRCYWKGSHKAFLDHIATDHQDYVRVITSETKFSLKSNNCFYYVYDNNYFKLWIDKRIRTFSGNTQKYYNIFFCHLTTQANSNYNFIIRITSNTTPLLKTFAAPCDPYGGCVEPLGVVIDDDSYDFTIRIYSSRK